MPKFSMNDYTGVNDRMKLAADTWQSIVVSPPQMLTDLAGFVTATVTLKDGRSVTELAAFRLGLTGASAQANFPIEDAATSAVGRALGRFGFGTDTNFPSREEMQHVERVQAAPTATQELFEAPKTPDPREPLRNELRQLRQELGAAGGRPSALRSSQVMAMTAQDLQEEIRLTRDEIKAAMAKSSQQELQAA